MRKQENIENRKKRRSYRPQRAICDMRLALLSLSWANLCWVKSKQPKEDMRY